MTVCIGTYGTPAWAKLASERAMPSAYAQGCEVILTHAATLASARNACAKVAETEWLIFVDADDELEPGYVSAMAAGTADMRAPALFEQYADGHRMRVNVESRDIEQLNPCAIGTAVRRDLFIAAGGFPDFGGWEDWALYLRMHRRGATLEHVGSAVYTQHVSPDSRNRTISRPRELARAIREWA